MNPNDENLLYDAGCAIGIVLRYKPEDFERAANLLGLTPFNRELLVKIARFRRELMDEEEAR